MDLQSDHFSIVQRLPCNALKRYKGKEGGGEVRVLYPTACSKICTFDLLAEEEISWKPRITRANLDLNWHL